MASRRFGTQSLVRLLGNWQESASRTPLWRQLAEALRLLILDGRLTLETRLPGERELATALKRKPHDHRQRARPAAGRGVSLQPPGQRLAHRPAPAPGWNGRTGRQRHVGEPWPPPPSAPGRKSIRPTIMRWA